jgi:hypothetical protein
MFDLFNNRMPDLIRFYFAFLLFLNPLENYCVYISNEIFWNYTRTLTLNIIYEI